MLKEAWLEGGILPCTKYNNHIKLQYIMKSNTRCTYNSFLSILNLSFLNLLLKVRTDLAVLVWSDIDL